MKSRDQLLTDALALHGADNLAQAKTIYQQMLAANPNDPDALRLLGTVLAKTGDPTKAIELIAKAVAFCPGIAEYHCSLGIAQALAGRASEAVDSFRRAIAIRADFDLAFNNLANVLSRVGRLDDAIAAYRRALELNPDYVDAMSNLAIALKSNGQLVETVELCERVLRLAPGDAELRSNYLSVLNYLPGITMEKLRFEQARWNQVHALPVTRMHLKPRKPGKLRIGYVSADFRDHVVGWNIMPLLAHHDHSAFEIYLYSNVVHVDAFTDRLKRHADHWRNIVGLDDEAVCRMVVEDNIDVLMDLSLHSAGNRLTVFARKPAPVQGTFAGYPGSTGLTPIDFRLTDPFLDPPGMFDAFCSEKTIRLEHCFWCYDPEAMGLIGDGGLACDPVTEPPMTRNGFVTFGCLNNIFKVSDESLELWSKVMKRTDNSRLMLLAPEGSARKRMLGKLSRLGIAENRVEFLPRMDRAEYFKAYERIDIGLDTLPYNGHTTSLDSLWMGVPVVTLVGETICGRAGFSQLSNIGLSELIAREPDEFVKLVAELAKDRAQLSQLRRSLRDRMLRSPLCDAPKFARNVEKALREMWEAFGTRDN